ncbi:hypothetical protein [Nocardia sp. CNY236]|uniref:hypothetical protein n=1 Tax=Nocardia sp. CNY236 TaxID=1169152 RepID=UPI0004077E51|nr:hypothetical protein [Nocardia sp. CNY236]
MNWENNLRAADPEVLAIAQHDWDECRASYGPRAVMWADTLRVAAFGGATGGEPCGHGAGFRLPTELLLEMPGPLALALTDAQLGMPEGPWPEWARTEHPIDWPTLIADDPEHLTWNHGMLAANLGATGDSVAAAYRLLHDHDLHPYMDVCLWLAPDGRFSVEPLALFTVHEVDPELRREVDDILVAGGRPRDRLRDDDEPGSWTLDA